MDLDGRVALVTGGAHGIGAATAQRLRAEGVRVMIADREPVASETALRPPGDGPGERADDVDSVVCDVTDTASVDRAVARTVERFGGLDLVVAAAGGSFVHAELPEITDDEWDRMIDLNLTSLMRLVRAALPALRRSHRHPAVVAIGSVNGLAGWGDEPYSAAKAGLVNLVQNLAQRLGPDGIRVNLVAPGTIRTRVWDDQPDSLARLAPLYPLGRVGRPEDVAAAVAFLCSGDADWITGVTLPVDGGGSVGPFQALRAMEELRVRHGVRPDPSSEWGDDESAGRRSCETTGSPG